MTTETQFSKTSNFYTFIDNLAKMGKLNAQIEAKEETLDAIEAAISVYDSIGTTALTEIAVVRYNKLREEVLNLRLKRNELERQTLLFELNSLKDE